MLCQLSTLPCHSSPHFISSMCTSWGPHQSCMLLHVQHGMWSSGGEWTKGQCSITVAANLKVDAAFSLQRRKWQENWNKPLVLFLPATCFPNWGNCAWLFWGGLSGCDWMGGREWESMIGWGEVHIIFARMCTCMCEEGMRKIQCSGIIRSGLARIPVPAGTMQGDPVGEGKRCHNAGFGPQSTSLVTKQFYLYIFRQLYTCTM